MCVCELRYSDADTDVNGDFWCVVLFWGAFCYREHINPVHCQTISDMKEKIQGEKNRRNKKKLLHVFSEQKFVFCVRKSIRYIKM